MTLKESERKERRRVCVQMIHLTSDKDGQGHRGRGKLYMNDPSTHKTPAISHSLSQSESLPVFSAVCCIRYHRNVLTLHHGQLRK